MKSRRNVLWPNGRDYQFYCDEFRLWRAFGGIENDTRKQFIIDSIANHMSRSISPERYEDQYTRQLGRLEPRGRWTRKNMKGYHLREVVVK